MHQALYSKVWRSLQMPQESPWERAAVSYILVLNALWYLICYDVKIYQKHTTQPIFNLYLMRFSKISSNTTYCVACTHLIAVHKIFQLKCFWQFYITGGERAKWCQQIMNYGVIMTTMKTSCSSKHPACLTLITDDTFFICQLYVELMRWSHMKSKNSRI